MTNKYHRAFQGFVKAFTGAAKAGEKGNPTTIIGVAPSKNIKKFQEQKEKIIKMTDSYKSKVNDPKIKKKMNEGTSKTLSNISKIYKGEKVKKAMGGRIGYKGGSDDGSNLNKSINSLKRIMEDRKNRKKSKITNSRRERSPMERQRVLDTMKSEAQAMGGNVRTAGEMSPLKGESMKSFKERTESKVGGRMGRKLGGGTNMAKRKTNVQKIKETFAPKNKNLKPVDKNKQKGLSKLPIEVRNKMGYAKKGGRA